MGRVGRRAWIGILLLTILAVSGLPSGTSAQTVTTSGFTAVSAVWGSAAAPAEAAPGTQNVPLVVTLQYSYFNVASGVGVSIGLPTGFTDVNGNSAATTYVSGDVPSGAVLPLTFYLDIAQNVQLGSYTFPVTITWGAITNPVTLQSVSMTELTSVSIFLRGKVLLQFSSTSPTLSAGSVNRVPLAITNAGTGNATDVDLAVTATSSLLSSATVSVLNTPPQISVIPANSSVTTNLNVYAPQSLAGSSFSLTIAGSYSDAYGNARAISGSLGLYVQSALSQPITITAGPSQLTPGTINNVTITIANAGNRALALVQVNVVVPPSVSLLKQFPVTVSNLAANASAQVGMPVFVSSALSGTPITVAATVTYTDTAGSTGSASQSLGFYIPVAQSPNIGLSGFSYDPQLVFPGTIVGSLEVVVFNSGTTPGTNINVTLIPSSPVYSMGKGSLTQVVGLLPVGQSAPLAFTIGIQNSTAPINSTLTLVIKSPGVATSQYSIPFVEEPKAHFDVVSVDSPGVASGDGADELTVTLRNNGMAAAQLTTFALQPSYVFEPSTQGSFTTTPNAGVGTISPGGTANVTVVLQVNSNLEPGSYPLVFRATWTQLGASQPFGQDIALMIPVKSSVFQTADSTILSVPFFAIIVLLIVVLLVRRSRRRARRNPKGAPT